ncbi:monoglyceride lipase [Lepeophtheirus salmonis]|uniref:Monoglyceride lipase [Zonotrichia albicollis] n=1 Tax=Lepeophtheirus salmonis TaxID=72036 RepID=A0A0K2UG29_LEPSM|nr:monoglyceride lipase-like [Lepeophtheirus salmonis]
MSQEIKQESSKLEGPSGHSLHEIKWYHPDKDTKGLVYLCHGYDEHIQYYEEIGKQLAERGFLAFGHDHPGHGKSSGPYLQANSFEKDYADNVIFSCESKNKEFNEKVPLYIIGHSMGGLIAFRAIIKRPELFKAAVLMGAALMLPPEQTSYLKVAAIKFVNYFLPNLSIGKLCPDEITRDKELLEQIKNDPLRGRAGVKASFGCAFMDEIINIERRLGEVRLPVLVQYGENDTIIPPTASEIIFDAISSTDKEKHKYSNAFHNLYYEIPEVRNEAIQEAVAWIENHN